MPTIENLPSVVLVIEIDVLAKERLFNKRENAPSAKHGTAWNASSTLTHIVVAEPAAAPAPLLGGLQPRQIRRPPGHPRGHGGQEERVGDVTAAAANVEDELVVAPPDAPAEPGEGGGRVAARRLPRRCRRIEVTAVLRHRCDVIDWRPWGPTTVHDSRNLLQNLTENGGYFYSATPYLLVQWH